MFSIIIPTFNNLDYLKLCIKSIRQNSKYTHQIIPHVNIGSDKTSEFLVNENIDFTFTDYNSGICEGMNTASKKSRFEYILYSHDDFYFCPGWDIALKKEIEKIGHNRFYLSGIMMNNGPIKCDFGNDLKSFDEKKLLNEYKNYNDKLVSLKKVDNNVLQKLNNYLNFVSNNVALRQQSKLPRNVALYLAKCNSEHRDLSIYF